MSVVGIIAEYNPFHKGHEYHIKKAKEETGADYAVVVMSGNFVQRGEPAIFNKYSRTEMALRGGADLIIELPACFATSSANFFAKGAASLLERLGIVDYLSFGSECGDIEALSCVAKALVDESEEYQACFKAELKKGKSIPAARQIAIDYIGLDGKLLDSPNNILAIEYLMALYEQKSDIKVHTIKRMGAGYNDQSIKQSEDEFMSAMGIRKALESGFSVVDAIPNNSCDIINDQSPLFYTDIESAMFVKLFDAYKSDNITSYADVSGDFANKIKNVYFDCGNLEQLLDKLATKDSTLSHTKRGLLHILLKHNQTDFDDYIQNDYNFFARILGFRRDAKELLGLISKADNLPIISNPKSGIEVLNRYYEADALRLKLALQQYKENCYADDVYRMLQTLKYKQRFKHDFEYKSVVV